MAPKRAAEIFLQRYPEAQHYRVILFASLAATGKGHLTDKALEEVFSQRSLEVLWRQKDELPLHPTGMRFQALDDEGQTTDSRDVYSIGGGALLEKTEYSKNRSFYPLTTMDAVLNECRSSGRTVWQVKTCPGFESSRRSRVLSGTPGGAAEKKIALGHGVPPGSRHRQWCGLSP